MIKVGLTGNIGSGKTTVCKIFEILSIPVFYADLEAKKILDEPDVIKSITKFLGRDILNEDGKANRQIIASIVFNNKKLLEKLNSVVHPLVIAQYMNWLSTHKNKPYTVKEAAILIESGYYKGLDKIIVVASEEKLMIERVAKRDNVDEVSVKNRLKNQMKQDEKIEKADYVIYNCGNQMLITQVLNIDNTLKEL